MASFTLTDVVRPNVAGVLIISPAQRRFGRCLLWRWDGWPSKGSRLVATCVSKAGPGFASREVPDAAPPTGATSLRGTVVSLPDGKPICAYCRAVCTTSTSSHTGSYFDFSGAPMALQIHRTRCT